MPGPSRDTGYGLSTAMAAIQRARADTIRSRYKDPFTDMASRTLPDDVQRLRKLCRYWMFTHPVISPLLQKASKYPVTSPKYLSDNENLRNKYRELMEGRMKIRLHLAEFNLDYNGYGVAYSMVLPPFRKMLVCASCHSLVGAADVDFMLEDGQFRFKCPKCGYHGIAKSVHDIQYRSASGIRLIRLNPDYVRTRVHPITKEKVFYLITPTYLANAFTTNQRHTIARTPQVFIDAFRKKMDVEFLPNQIFCAERPAPSNDEFLGTGIPMIMPALKHAYMMQLAMGAQEAILLEHVLPIRFAFPANSPELARVLSMSDLTEHIRTQLKEQRHDQNRFIVFPFQVGVAEFGGQGRALMLSPELREMALQICYACGFPQEFLMGGLSYSGSNISLRMLENDFMFVHEMNIEHLQFVADRISEFMGWPNIVMEMKLFKMADDLQRAAFDAQLADRKWMSVSSLLQSLDRDPDVERRLIDAEIPAIGKLVEKEQIYRAKASVQAMLVQAKGQMEAQAMQGMATAPAPTTQQAPPYADAQQPVEEQPPEGTVEGVESPARLGQMQFDTEAYARYILDKLQTMGPAEQRMALAALKEEQPGIASIVMRALAGERQPQINLDESFAAPLPEQRPPRRSNSPI